MAVKHKPTGEIHKGYKGGTTGCGFDTKENPDHWSSTNNKITCAKNGCKNWIKYYINLKIWEIQSEKLWYLMI